MLNNHDLVIRMHFNCVQNNTIQETVSSLKQGNGKSWKENLSITKQNENTLAQSQLQCMRQTIFNSGLGNFFLLEFLSVVFNWSLALPSHGH